MINLFQEFKEEAEMFFVTKMLSNKELRNAFVFGIDLIFKIYNSDKVDYSRGLIAYNEKYGQGKSFFFEVVHHRYKRLEGKNLFKQTSAKELVKVFKESGENGLLDFISVKNLFIDDIGDEGAEKEFSHYNNKLNVIRYVLLKRYEFWIAKGWRTFGTTNLSINQIAQQYDGRVADRLMQMVYYKEFDFLKSGTFRQVADSRRLTQEEIADNWKKLEVVKEPEKVDILKYMNGLLSYEDSYFDNLATSDWTMIKEFLLEKKVISEELFSEIDEDRISAARDLMKKEYRETVRVLYGNASKIAQSNALKELFSGIKRNDVIKFAENLIVKKELLKIKKQENFTFA